MAFWMYSGAEQISTRKCIQGPLHRGEEELRAGDVLDEEGQWVWERL